MDSMSAPKGKNHQFGNMYLLHFYYYQYISNKSVIHQKFSENFINK